jgi:hypothetical protein
VTREDGSPRSLSDLLLDLEELELVAGYAIDDLSVHHYGTEHKHAERRRHLAAARELCAVAWQATAKARVELRALTHPDPP